MKVGLDITQTVKRRGRGIARYIRALLPYLAKLAVDAEQDFQPVPYIRRERFFRRSLVHQHASNMPARWLPLPWYLPGIDLDLFHSFGNHLPAVSRVPLSFTVHDIRALDLDSSEGKSDSRLHRNVARSAGLLCLTEYGRARLLERFPHYDPSCVVVVPHGVDHDRFRPRDPDQSNLVARRYGLARPFLLQLGSWFPHKNLELAIVAFSVSRARAEGYRLAFVGGSASANHQDVLATLARTRGVSDLIDWIEDVGSDDIPDLISAASCLVHPSYYEGFGLPILEAMAVGTPGVVSDSTCLPEVSGGAWPVAEQDNAEAFAEEIDALVFDNQTRNAVIKAGIDRAASFSWERTARDSLRFFRLVAAKSRNPS